MSRGPDIETGVSFGVGPIDIDIEMARVNGWTQAQLDAATLAVAAISREISYQVALTRGYTYKCLRCECWTVQPPAPCHLCHADEIAAMSVFEMSDVLGSTEYCVHCTRHISEHYGGTSLRCYPYTMAMPDGR